MRLSTLERGCHGTQVELLQQLLNNTVHPHPLLVLDGEFGPKTGAAVRRFQSINELETDEIIGRQSWAALGIKPSEMPNPTPKPAVPTAVFLQAGEGVRQPGR